VKFERKEMTKPEMLRLMRLLSALESLVVYSKPNDGLIDSLLQELSDCVEILEKEILK